MLADFGNEDSVVDLIIEVLNPNKKDSFKFIDCGANKGNYSKKIIKKLNCKFYGYLIEPNKELNEIILKNLYDFKSQIKIINICCGAYKGNIDFNINSDNTTSSALMVEEIMKNKTDNYEAKEKITCKVDKIDNLFLEHETFDFLKVDAQGYDLEVLKGSLNILKNQKIKGVLVEFIEAKLYKNQFKLSSLLEFMDSVNYKLHSFPSLTHTSKGNLYYGDAFFISKEFAKEKNY